MLEEANKTVHPCSNPIVDLAQDSIALKVVHHEVAGIESGNGEGESGKREIVAGGFVAESEMRGGVGIALVVFVEGEDEVVFGHPVAKEGVAFGGGQLKPDMVESLDGGLTVNVELAQGLEGVVEELEPDGVGGIGGKEVENTASTSELETGVNLGDLFKVLGKELGLEVGGVENEVGVELESGFAQCVSFWSGSSPSGGGKEDGGVSGIGGELVESKLPITARTDVGLVLEFRGGDNDGFRTRKGREFLFQLVAFSWVRHLDPEP